MSLLQLAGVALFLSLFLILLSNQWNKNDTLQSTPRSLLQLTSLSSSKLRLPAFEGPQGQGNYGYMFEDSQIYQHSKYVVNARGPGDVAAASDRLLASTSGLSTTSMIQSFQEAKARLEEKLRRDYGADYFDGIFRPKLDGKPMNVGRYLYVSQPETELSWQRMKRRMIKKILQVHTL